MIRTACAWALIVLAASPVTAPFATCDLRQLVASAPAAMPAMAATMQMSSSPALDATANSVSPVLTQREPQAESRTGSAVLPFHGVFAVARGVDRPPQAHRVPRDRSTRITVLRV